MRGQMAKSPPRSGSCSAVVAAVQPKRRLIPRTKRLTIRICVVSSLPHDGVPTEKRTALAKLRTVGLIPPLTRPAWRALVSYHYDSHYWEGGEA